MLSGQIPSDSEDSDGKAYQQRVGIFSGYICPSIYQQPLPNGQYNNIQRQQTYSEPLGRQMASKPTESIPSLYKSKEIIRFKGQDYVVS